MNDITISNQPNLPADTPVKTRKRRISPRIKKALTLIVSRGLTREAAAQKVGISESTIYKALQRKNVQALLEKIATDLRDNDRHQNFHVIRTLRDDPKTTPYVRSDLAKYLDAKYEPKESGGNSRAPANVVIVRFGSDPSKTVDVTPRSPVVDQPADGDEPGADIVRFGDEP